MTPSTVVGLGLVALIATGCGISKEIYQADVTRLRGQIRELETNNATLLRRSGEFSTRATTCEQNLGVCQRELSALRSQGAQLDANLAEALRRIQELEAIAARQKAVFDRLRQALDSLVRAGKLRIAIVRGQFTVQMSTQILFDSGKSELKPEAEETLREVTQILASIPDRAYQLVGHTDTDGSEDFNWKLSGNRSRVVLQFMLGHGMGPRRVTFAGAGMFSPTASNDTPEDKALNRRIEIVLVPNLEELLGPLQERPATP